MALCYDDAFFQFDFPLWPDQRTPGGALQIAGLPDHAFNTQTSRICHRDLYLGFLAAGTKYDDFLKAPFRPGDCQTLFAGVLPRLAELLCKCRFGAFSEQRLKIFLCDVDMSRRSLDGDC